jgi:hypothetical protein
MMRYSSEILNPNPHTMKTTILLFGSLLCMTATQAQEKSSRPLSTPVTATFLTPGDDAASKAVRTIPAQVNVNIIPAPVVSQGFLILDAAEPYYNFYAASVPGCTYQWVFQPQQSSPAMFISDPTNEAMWIEDYTAGTTYIASLVLSDGTSSQTVWRQKVKVQ